MLKRDYRIIKELGKGSFSNVYLVISREDDKIYAMKKIKTSQLSDKNKDNALNEIRILASIKHPNIIGYRDSYFEEDTKILNIIMDYADDGDLENKIKLHSKLHSFFTEDEIFSIFIQIIQGLKALHDKNIIHRDLKAANLFLMKTGDILIGDLNVAKVITKSLAYTQTGTPFYASPEVWADKPYDFRSDIWSVGVILYELCTLKPPFKGANLKELYKSVMKGEYEPLPSSLSKDLGKLIKQLLQINPRNRPTCSEILNNPIVEKRLNKNLVFESITLMKTMRFPINLYEVNKILPTKHNSVNSINGIIKETQIQEIQENKIIDYVYRNNKNYSNENKNKFRNKSTSTKILNCLNGLKKNESVQEIDKKKKC